MAGKAKYVGCKIEGCNGKHHSNGYCDRHRMQILRKGYIYNKKAKELHGEFAYLNKIGEINE